MLGDNVRDARLRKGLTQRKLADLAGVSRRHLVALEKGANVSLLVLEKVAVVLELTEIQLGNVSVRRDVALPAFNVPLFADLLRNARAGLHRVEASIARTEEILTGHQEKAAPEGLPEQLPKGHFPTLRARPLARPASGSASERLSEQGKWLEVRTAGQFRQGQPVDERRKEPVVLPATFIEAGELLFRACGEGLREHGIEEGDLLVVQLRPAGKAATGELAIGKVGDALYVGRWWQKNGHRALMTDGLAEMAIGRARRSLKVMAVINAIIRPAK